MGAFLTLGVAFSVPFAAPFSVPFSVPFLGTASMGTRRGPAAPVVLLGRGGGRLAAATGGTAVFARQGQADQPLDVAQI